MKDSKFQWNPEAEASLQLIKQKLTIAPILVFPNFTQPFKLHCDVLNVGIDGVLSQKEFVLYIDHDVLKHIGIQDKNCDWRSQVLNTICDLYATDPYFSQIIRKLQKGVHLEFVWVDDFHFRGIQLCIPKDSLQLKIIHELHNESHVGHD
ncbi:uncharacterized protein LOC111385453 [Olea europaea var. sylvestris]|uniref:uncharacterized protein LOC111385453 n=1 Tax=Olea europaea var. sylvestris TaxID=158386 RepID=UPI000C1D0436|nr:uncharacterized protein LOC111385453 [Olea europaea var. sylvestris]